MMPEFHSRNVPIKKRIQILQVQTRTETLGSPNFLFFPGEDTSNDSGYYFAAYGSGTGLAINKMILYQIL
jgi:hypothetical protein